MTEWRAVVGYEGHYEISDTGELRSLDRVVTYTGRWQGKKHPHKGRALAQKTTRLGYRAVCLYRDQQCQHVRVHRLVLEAFVGPCPDGMEACHNDGDRQNNHLSNLRWDTHSNNVQDSIKHGTQAGARKTHCPRNHEYTPENTYYRPGRAGRNCRACARIVDRRRRPPTGKPPGGRPQPWRGCSVPGCLNKHCARGLCNTHYAAWRRMRELTPRIEDAS